MKEIGIFVTGVFIGGFLILSAMSGTYFSKKLLNVCDSGSLTIKQCIEAEAKP